ncbi:hypothetical protein KDL29_02435 [bacterium]|nr:hypothetical protein [bacterium]
MRLGKEIPEKYLEDLLLRMQDTELLHWEGRKRITSRILAMEEIKNLTDDRLIPLAIKRYKECPDKYCRADVCHCLIALCENCHDEDLYIFLIDCLGNETDEFNAMTLVFDLPKSSFFWKHRHAVAEAAVRMAGHKKVEWDAWCIDRVRNQNVADVLFGKLMQEGLESHQLASLLRHLAAQRDGRAIEIAVGHLSSEEYDTVCGCIEYLATMLGSDAVDLLIPLFGRNWQSEYENWLPIPDDAHEGIGFMDESLKRTELEDMTDWVHGHAFHWLCRIGDARAIEAVSSYMIKEVQTENRQGDSDFDTVVTEGALFLSRFLDDSRLAVDCLHALADTHWEAIHKKEKRFLKFWMPDIFDVKR